MSRYKLTSHISFSRKHLIVYISIFAVIAGAILLNSYAANPNLPGDINSDNKVDVTDLSILLSNYGTTNTTADLNNDGLVNITDLSILLSNYGKTYTPTATTINQTITNGSTLTGTITWLATTSNDSNVNSVDFYLDGTFRNTETSPPYASSDPPQDDAGQVDTTKLSNGSHTFKATANLKDGTTVSIASTATVSNTTTPPPPPTTVNCTKYASTTGPDSNPGTLAAPYRNPQKLVDNLTAGQTGCLRGGTYTLITTTPTNGLTFRNSGTATTPITFTSYPGERATISATNSSVVNCDCNVIVVPKGSEYLNITNLNISVPVSNKNGFRINANNTTLSGVDLTNNNIGGQCLLLGGTAAGETITNVRITNNRLHECGNPASGNQDHCIYAAHMQGGVIKNNYLYNCSGYAIQLYPDAHGVLFDHNTIDGGAVSIRGGVIFGGESAPVSSDNIVTNNIITYGAPYGISYWWGGPIGTGNQANNNCLWSATISNQVGFTASGNITTTSDPFNNRSAHDYSVKAGSSCAGKGVQ